MRSLDIFGSPISLSFKKNKVFKTALGGFATFLLISFMLLVSIWAFYQLFNNEYLESSKYVRNLGDVYGPLALDSSNFMLAFRLSLNYLNNWTNPYVNVTLTQMIQYRNSTAIVVDLKNIQLTQCTPTHFPGLLASFHLMKLDLALCPILGSNLTIEGNFQERLYTYLRVSVSKCTAKNC